MAQARLGGLATRHLRVNHAMKTPGLGRHKKMEDDLAIPGPRPDGFEERQTGGGAVGDDENARGWHVRLPCID